MRPERKGAALTRPKFIDMAAIVACIENAFAIRKALQNILIINFGHVFIAEFFDRHIHFSRYLEYFIWVDINIAIGNRAAIATTLALEAQTFIEKILHCLLEIIIVDFSSMTFSSFSERYINAK